MGRGGGRGRGRLRPAGPPRRKLHALHRARAGRARRPGARAADGARGAGGGHAPRRAPAAGVHVRRRGRRADDHDHRGEARAARRGPSRLGRAGGDGRRLLRQRRRRRCSGGEARPTCSSPRPACYRCSPRPESSSTPSCGAPATRASATRPAISTRRRASSSAPQATKGGPGLLPTGQRGPTGRRPVPGPIADTYGAGDSFAAGLTYALASGEDPEAAIEFAARAASEALTRRGAHGLG